MCRSRHHRPDKMFFFAPAPGGSWGPPFHSRRRRRRWSGRARRGDVRAGILALLADQEMHGYQIIHELEARSGGLWRPSPGSVYPTLQLLEDEGLVASEERDGKRVYSLTDEGRAEAQAAQERSGRLPWEVLADDVDDSALRLRESVFQVGAAAEQTVHAGSEDQMQRVIDVLAEARRRIYAVLAEDNPAD